MGYYWLGYVLGVLSGGAVVFIAAVLYIVLNRHHAAGIAEIMLDEMERIEQGRRWEDAEPRREARRQVLIKKYMPLIEQAMSAGAKR